MAINEERMSTFAIVIGVTIIGVVTGTFAYFAAMQYERTDDLGFVVRGSIVRSAIVVMAITLLATAHLHTLLISSPAIAIAALVGFLWWAGMRALFKNLNRLS